MKAVATDPPPSRPAEIRRRGSKDLLKVCVLAEVGEEAAAAEGHSAPPQAYERNGEKDKMAVQRPELDPRPPAEHEVARERKEGLGRTLSGTDAVSDECHASLTPLSPQISVAER